MDDSECKESSSCVYTDAGYNDRITWDATYNSKIEATADNIMDTT